MNKIYLLFSCYGDGDSYPVFDLVSVHRSFGGARDKSVKYLSSMIETRIKNMEENEHLMAWEERELKYLKEYGVEAIFDPIHESISRKNNYTYFGSREDDELKGMIDYSSFGGFIIEESRVED
jgi:hypothetical protein